MPRKTKQLAVRDEFLILTNGKRTEKNYFEAVRSNYKSIFKISVKFKKCSSDQLMILPTGRTSICLSVLLAPAVQHLLLNA